MKKIFYGAVAALTLTACQLDDNINPSQASAAQISPRELLAAAETQNYNVQAGSIMRLSNVWMNNWAGNLYYFAAPLSAEYEMTVTSTFYNGIWNDSYIAMNNYENIMNHPRAAEYPYHKAIASIMLANSMQYIVDFYGDAPYSEAFKEQAILTPKYDKGEDIYKSLVMQINEAIALIDNTIPSTSNEVKVSEDPILGGDMVDWKKVANTVKLRLLLRQSKVTDPAVRSFVDAQLATLASASFVDSDITINPGYSAANEVQQSPLYRNYGWLNYNDTAYNVNGYKYVGMISKHFASLLNGTDANTGVADPRRGRMYRAVGGTIVGIEQGGPKIPGAGEASFSALGWKYYNYGSVNSSMDGYIMLKSESELLQAEAAVLYPSIFTYSAEARYNAAVQSTMTFFGATAGSYLANLSTKPYGWNGVNGKIAAIQYQRMIALNLIKPQETYINYLKTGFPITPLALTATQANKPWRLIYPAREYQTNASNTPVVNTADIFVKNQFTPFWNR